jgi:hypothetical protein
MEALGESASAARTLVEVEAAATWEASTSGERAAASHASHHREQYLRIDAAAHATAKHIGWVLQIDATIIALALPAFTVSKTAKCIC